MKTLATEVKKLGIAIERAKSVESSEMKEKLYEALMSFLMSEFDKQDALYEADSDNYNEYFHNAVEDVWNMLYHLKNGAEPRYNK